MEKAGFSYRLSLHRTIRRRKDDTPPLSFISPLKLPRLLSKIEKRGAYVSSRAKVLTIITII